MSTMPKQRLCKGCGKPIPQPFRKCDECIVGESRGSIAIRRERVVDGSVPERDVVLSCGHVAASRAPRGTEHRCPIHRRVEHVLRVHDGREIPVIQP
jgi:hypothetical protein